MCSHSLFDSILTSKTTVQIQTKMTTRSIYDSIFSEEENLQLQVSALKIKLEKCQTHEFQLELKNLSLLQHVNSLERMFDEFIKIHESAWLKIDKSNSITDKELDLLTNIKNCVDDWRLKYEAYKNTRAENDIQ